jgi:hypothetical protein
MQVFYLDNVNFGAMAANQTLLPCTVDYPYGLVKKLARDDKVKTTGARMTLYGCNKVGVKTSSVLNLESCYEFFETLYTSAATTKRNGHIQP